MCFHSAGTVLCTVNYFSVIHPGKSVEFLNKCDREIKRGLLMKKRYYKPVINCYRLLRSQNAKQMPATAGAKLPDFHRYLLEIHCILTLTDFVMPHGHPSGHGRVAERLSNVPVRNTSVQKDPTCTLTAL